MTPATSTTRILIPHSPRISRAIASVVVSPSSTRPPGKLHFPNDGDWPRRPSSTLSSCRMTAPPPTRGESGGQAPLSERRRLAAAHEQHLVLVQDDGAHTDPRVVRVLAAHARPSR